MLGFRVWMIRFLLVASCLAAPVALLAEDSAPITPRSLKVARVNPFVFVRSDGSLYILGGVTEAGDVVHETEVYNIVTGSALLTTRPGPPYLDYWESAALLSRDRILVCNAENCALYDPIPANWIQLTLRGHERAPLIPLPGGKLLHAGGKDANSAFHGANTDTFLIDTQSFAVEQPTVMQYPTSNYSWVLLGDGNVFVTGGETYGPHGSLPNPAAEIFDYRSQSWRQAALPLYVNQTGAILLADGRVLVRQGNSSLENQPTTYDPNTDTWTNIDSFRWALGVRANVLPNGTVLFSGGSPNGIPPSDQTFVWDPETGAVRSARRMKIPRSYHATPVLPDGTVLAIGGRTTGLEVTPSVEVLSWGQPKTTLTLNPNFYVATANQSSSTDDGFWGLQASFPGYTDGGMFFGGLLAAQGSEVAFASFSITESQTVTVHADLLPFPNSKGALDITLRMLDSNRNPIAPSVSATGSVNWTGQLTPGFYVVELRSGANAPASVVNGSVNATRLQGGVSAGGSLAWSAGVTGWLAFSVADKQDVTFQLSNEQSYGIGRGAGSVVLTVLDGAGNTLKKLASGGN